MTPWFINVDTGPTDEETRFSSVFTIVFFILEWTYHPCQDETLPDVKLLKVRWISRYLVRAVLISLSRVIIIRRNWIRFPVKFDTVSDGNSMRVDALPRGTGAESYRLPLVRGDGYPLCFGEEKENSSEGRLRWVGTSVLEPNNLATLPPSFVVRPVPTSINSRPVYWNIRWVCL